MIKNQKSNYISFSIRQTGDQKKHETVLFQNDFIQSKNEEYFCVGFGIWNQTMVLGKSLISKTSGEPKKMDYENLKVIL